jgi:two-component system OmpR family response regulator
MTKTSPPGTMPLVRVLVVEDEAKLAELISKWLREAGVLADTTRRGEDALWMAAATAYDVIVLDLMLPGIDGLQTCRRLREAGVEAPILILTARDAVDYRIAGLEIGADDYLTKPSTSASSARACVHSRGELRPSEPPC